MYKTARRVIATAYFTIDNDSDKILFAKTHINGNGEEEYEPIEFAVGSGAEDY